MFKVSDFLLQYFKLNRAMQFNGMFADAVLMKSVLHANIKPLK